LDIYGKNIIFTHEPMSSIPTNFDVNVHGHLHTVNDNDRLAYPLTPKHKCFTLEHHYSPILLQKFIGM
jgi:hypothetical protein